MSKRRDLHRQHEIRKAHRAKRQTFAAVRRLRAKRRNAGPKGIKTVPRNGFRQPSFDEIGQIKIPSTFSLLEDPDKVLETYQDIEFVLSMTHKRRVNVFHSGCGQMDLGASILLDTLFMAAEKRRLRRGEPKLEIQGYGSRNEDVNIMLFASGLPTRLGVPIQLPAEIQSRVRTFERQCGTSSHAEKDKNRNQCATDLTDYFDGCLKQKGYSLSAIGKANMGILVTEVIGNAQEHAGPWHAIGFYDDLKLGRVGGECHIVIFNYGPSIYETLRAPDVSEQLVEDLKTLSQHHADRGWLSHRLLASKKAPLTEECLWTLYALQDRVTRFFGRPGGEDRGAGTVKMIEFFEQLAGDAPMRMCVLSGGAYILFDGTHKIRPVKRGQEELKVIAFNDDNDLHKPPDPKYVRQLRKSFPGTVISIRLTLDRNVLERLAQGNGNETRS